ncbi:hypothetical protein HYALB_00013026 [Hymenoscyphus albidus]|uniref:F-box domain-containing protein n=1 Tax=Hymenoscyphus albidus TaxID=595503 RepID=A0A9N9LPK1_9HELO|nr:hypothetical protein HYALB_00013026 [Hymenoscyphus albidus]
MSSTSSESRSAATDSCGSYEEFELQCLGVIPSLPAELQDRIVKTCDTSSLVILVQLNKSWNHRVTPLLWENLDFVNGWDQPDDEPPERVHRFFVTCYDLKEDQPERWATLAPLVRTLDLGRLHGINLIIAEFVNLESLSVYVKSWWGGRVEGAATLARGLTRLRSLKVGGQFPDNLLQGLFVHAESIEHLSILNLHTTPGQDNGPDGFALNSEIYARLTRLKSLHLCKLADLDGSMPQRERYTYLQQDDGDEEVIEYEFASGMPWEFPRNSEVAVLNAWAKMLQRCSETLEEVTLENRYLCCNDLNPSARIQPGGIDPLEYGAYSIQQSQEILFPVFSSQDWPKLKRLTWIGMGEQEEVRRATSYPDERVEIEVHLAAIQQMYGDVTPIQVSTPMEFHTPESWVVTSTSHN